MRPDGSGHARTRRPVLVEMIRRGLAFASRRKRLLPADRPMHQGQDEKQFHPRMRFQSLSRTTSQGMARSGSSSSSRARRMSSACCAGESSEGDISRSVAISSQSSSTSSIFSSRESSRSAFRRELDAIAEVCRRTWNAASRLPSFTFVAAGTQVEIGRTRPYCRSVAERCKKSRSARPSPYNAATNSSVAASSSRLAIVGARMTSSQPMSSSLRSRSRIAPGEVAQHLRLCRSAKAAPKIWK